MLDDRRALAHPTQLVLGVKDVQGRNVKDVLGLDKNPQRVRHPKLQRRTSPEGCSTRHGNAQPTRQNMSVSLLLHDYGNATDRSCEVLVLLVVRQCHYQLVVGPVDGRRRVGIVHWHVYNQIALTILLSWPL